MLIEDRMIRELTEKSQIKMTDQVVIEDMEGTKLGNVASLRTLMMNNLIFNTVEDMKSATLVEGDVCITLGYRTIGDGGGATYKIVYEPTASDDRGNYHYLYGSDVNRAKFISIDGTVKPEQFGAYGDGKHADNSYINLCLKTKYEIIFNKSRSYSLEAQLSMESGKILNLNGCRLIGFPGIIVDRVENTSNSVFDQRTTIIENGRLDNPYMILFKDSNSNVIIRNIVFNQLMDSVIDIRNGVNSLVIDNCLFLQRRINTTQISYLCNDVEESSHATYKNISITNCKFINAMSVFGIRGTSLTGISINMENCSFFSEANLQHNVNQMLHVNLSTECGIKAIFNNIRTNYARNLFTSNNDICASISNIYMNQAESLYTSPSKKSVITISGDISFTGSAIDYAGEPIEDKFNLFGNTGSIYLNTQNITYDSDRFQECRPGFFHSGSVFDQTDMRSRHIIPGVFGNTAAGTDNTIILSTIHNQILRINNSKMVDNIAGGMGNQVIGLLASEDTEIKSTNIELHSNPDSTILKKGKTMMLKNIEGKWREI